jgi:hypothetical protein
MYLSSLGEREKRLFLELVRHAVLLDGAVADSEVHALDSYVHECELSNYKPLGLHINQIVDELGNSSPRVKSVILLELWSLLYCDKLIQEVEEIFIADIANKWSFSSAQLRRYQRWAKDFIDIVADGQRLINDN